MNWKILALAAVAGAQLAPVEETTSTPELALLMGDLQRLTHKLALSADAGNTELAAFYLHESQEQLRKIQNETPEYENIPVALLIDRLAHPAYVPMQEAVAVKDEVDPILRPGKRKVKLVWSRLGCDWFRSWLAVAQGLCSAI